MRCALVAAVAIAACGGPQIRTEERPVDLTKLLPATLEARKVKDGAATDAKTLHLRVYVDAAVRASPKWKDEIGDQIDYASQLLQPLVGAKLVVDAYKDWDRDASVSDTQALVQLTELDKLDQLSDKRVAWVLGFVAPSETGTKVLADLGDARPLGRHVIVRAWNEKTEVELLTAQLPAMNGGSGGNPRGMNDAEKAEVIAAHRRHKQTVVLLHALATTMGGIAETDPTWLQNPTYSIKQTTFSERNTELFELAIAGRDDLAEDDAIAKKLIDSIEKAEYGGWIEGEKDLVLAALRLAVDRVKAGKTAENIPPAAYEQWSRIRELRKRDPKEALVDLDTLLQQYPANATMHQLRCDILLGKPGVADPKTRAACSRVTELAPGEPGPHLAVGEALAKTKDLLAARAELEKAEAKIGNLPDGGLAAWKRLVGIYAAMGSITWTEDAIAKAKLPPEEPAALQAAQTRARYGVPKGGKIIPLHREGEYVAAVRAGLDLVYASKYGEAGKQLAAGEKAFPGGPGFLAVRCDLLMRQGSMDAARGMCKRALDAYPDLSWALYLGGVIDLRDTGTTPAGIAKLKKAIAVDPDLGQAWRTLAKAYARGNNKAELAELDKAYQVKFGSALPR